MLIADYLLINGLCKLLFRIIAYQLDKNALIHYVPN